MQTETTKQHMLDYLIELSLNPLKQRIFQQSPEVALESAGFSPGACALLKSGDRKAIYNALGEDHYIHGVVFWWL
jgi:hypothetical protein